MKANNFKAGLFVLFSLLLLFYIILKVGQGGLFRTGEYAVHMQVPTAVGLDRNTPVQIAGVTIGTVSGVSLTPDNKAMLTLSIQGGVKLPRDTSGAVKQTGILGDSYVELVPGPGLTGDFLREGSIITDVSQQGDLSSVTGQFSLIAEDVKAVTSQFKKLMAGDNSTLAVTMANIEKITTSLAKVSVKNEDNLNAIIANLRIVSQNLNYALSRNMGHFNDTMSNIDGITTTINRGEGTIGRLVKDEETVEKLNDTLDSLNEFVGGASRMNVEMGAHSEYLGSTGSMKNYVSLALQPRPDKSFIFEVTSDPDPSFSSSREITEITSGGVTNTVDVTRHEKAFSKFQFSAQLAKKFENLTLRGGLIESSGGVGVDYNYGPWGLQLSAFDFKTELNQRPHFKALGTAQVTRTFYLLGGLDDFINKNQDLDWFVGGGIRFTDDDIKSLLGIFGAAR